jgi:hypothetical protein
MILIAMLVISIVYWLKNVFVVVSQIRMTFQEIRIIATGPSIENQLREINTICRRSWFIAAHIWKIYDFKIEVIPFIINVSTELTTLVKLEVYVPN